MKNNRRLFLKNIGIAGSAAAIMPSAFAAKIPETDFISRFPLNYSGNNIIRIALIGAGPTGL